MTKRILGLLLCIFVVIAMPKIASAAEMTGDDHITFSSTEMFSISAMSVGWDSTIEYSTDNLTWTVWDGNSISAAQGGGTYYLCFRGIGNTVITGSMGNRWQLNATANIICDGNIMTLLNYENPDSAVMTPGCFNYMFYNWTLLTVAPELPTSVVNNSDFESMFSGCIGLTTVSNNESYNTKDAKIIPSTNDTANYAAELVQMTGDDHITFSSSETFTISANNQWDGTIEYSTDNSTWTKWYGNAVTASKNGNRYYLCFRGTGNTVITGNYNLIKCWKANATSDIECYGNIMTLLSYKYPGSTTMSSDCFKYMFYKWEKLTKAPELPSTQLVYECYKSMFEDCVSLAVAPELPATKLSLAGGCYESMFKGCTSLIAAPKLTALVTTQWCYKSMFEGCTSLSIAPELPATTLSWKCYYKMFSGCTNLSVAPALPATKLDDCCYQLMFEGCTNLKTAPHLFATKLANNCYKEMFSGCKNLTLYQTGSGLNWCIPDNANADAATDWNTNMFKNTGGDIDVSPIIGKKYYYNPNVVTEITGEDHITFSSAEVFSINAQSNGWDGTIEYSTDNLTWTIWDGSSISAVQSGDTSYYLCFRGTGNTAITRYSNGWVLKASSDVECDGNIMTLLDYECPDNATMANGCFFDMFKGWTHLTVAPELPATTLNHNCYSSMFEGCTALIKAPELPATILKSYCYSGMFMGCTNLSTVPELPALVMEDYCYMSMFEECSSLTVAPELPATTLSYNCYSSMFEGCTGLIKAPELPATILKNNCYTRMFMGCTSLTSTPKLPATTLTEWCYAYMFYGCTNLTTAHELPALAMKDYCYLSMFEECSSLTAAPELPATTLADYCYQVMFRGCTSLTSAPKLPALELTDYCYNGMFWGCTSLKTAPELPATKLAQYCYSCMFFECKELSATPDLPAEVMVEECYGHMFKRCTKLTRVPELPAITLAFGCYDSMFEGCTGITLYSAGNGETWSITADADDTNGESWNCNMFLDAGGNITEPIIGMAYYYDPTGIFIKQPANTEALAGDEASFSFVFFGDISNTYSSVLKYKDGDKWVDVSTVAPESGTEFFGTINAGDIGNVELSRVYMVSVYSNGKWIDSNEFTVTWKPVFRSVSGTITSFGSNTDDIIIQLFVPDASEPSYEVTVSGNSANYAINDVARGTYTMKVSKVDYVTREYTITINTEDVSQDIELYLIGDVNADGKISIVDLKLVCGYIMGNVQFTDTEIASADINGDGNVNVTDAVLLCLMITG